MKKLISLLTLICGCIALSQSQALSASRLSRSVEGLGTAETKRQWAIQEGYNHLPNTYDIIQRLVKVNPRVRANKLEKKVIARSIIANALLINNFSTLITHYMVGNESTLASRMAYLSISAIALCLKEGKSASMAKEYSKHLKYNKVTNNKTVLFAGMIEKYSHLTHTLYGSVSRNLVAPPEEDFKEEKSNRHSTQTFTVKMSPQVTPVKYRPCNLWDFYPTFYQAILKKIRQKTRIYDEHMVDYYMSAVGPWKMYENKPSSWHLVGGLKTVGLSETDINTLMQMFSLVIPQAPDRWAQIKRQAAIEINELKATFKAKLLSLSSCSEEVTRQRMSVDDFLFQVRQIYYTYMFLDEDELYRLLASDQETLVMSQQMNLAVQNLIFLRTNCYFEHTGRLREIFQYTVMR